MEVCQLRLKLNKQASIVLLRLGPTVRTAWEPIIQHCLELFQSRDDLDASRLIIHDTMPFHPSALYTKSGKHDRSYQAEQLKDFFADMDWLAEKLGSVDGKGHFECLILERSITARHSWNVQNEKCREPSLSHMLRPTWYKSYT